MELKVNDSLIRLVKGDITEFEADAIVNPANSNLKMIGGIAGAILHKGGLMIQEECDKVGRCQVGGAVITSAGRLKAKHVIHTVGPVWGEGNEDEKLKIATISCLKLADKNKVKTIVFPAISTGMFGFPKDRCARIMLSATKSYLKGVTRIKEVTFCLHDDEILSIFGEALSSLK
jgi:O-acetyl-ADP-ribose deacetylase (regulator of RNase III)